MIVVTGGAGFIGSCYVWKLNQEGISNIIVVDEVQKIPELLDEIHYLLIFNAGLSELLLVE